MFTLQILILFVVVYHRVQLRDLYWIYTDDLHCPTKHCKVNHFVNGTNHSNFSHSTKKLNKQVSYDLKNLNRCLNANKTEVVLFKSQQTDYDLHFKLNGKRLKRSSRLEVFCRKGVLKNFAKFTGKHLMKVTILFYQLFFSKLLVLCICVLFAFWSKQFLLF